MKHTAQGAIPMIRFPQRARRSRGFSLIEALVALVVTAFGMIALAGFQSTLAVASENAKHRAEALRLAQLKMEDLRSFEQIDTGTGKVSYTADVVSGGPETIDSASGYTTSNAYTRQWWVTRSDGVTAATGTDPRKWIHVKVTWTDRQGRVQDVSVRSVISRAQPADLGTLAVGPGVRQPRTPKGRNVDIPYPAISLPGGKSAFTPPGSSVAFIFDNVSGDVLGYCLTATNLSSGVNLDSAAGTITAGCTASKGYLLSGYIRFYTASNLPSGSEKNVDDALTNPVDDTRELAVVVAFPSFAAASSVVSVIASAPGNRGTTTATSSTWLPAPAAQCFALRQKVVTTNTTATTGISTITRAALTGLVTVTTSGNHGFDTGQLVSINDTTDSSFIGVYTVTKISNTSFSYSQTITTAASESGSPGTATRIQQITIAESDTAPTGYSNVVSRFVAYVCVVTPSDDDGDNNTPLRWWGRTYIVPLTTAGSPWTLGTGSNDFKVCRFSGDYVNDNKISNSENPLHYRGVSGALDNQNFLIIKGNNDCPTDSKIDTLAGDYVNTHTLQHQTGASGAGGALSDTSAQWATTPEPAAPTSASSPLPMF